MTPCPARRAARMSCWIPHTGTLTVTLICSSRPSATPTAMWSTTEREQTPRRGLVHGWGGGKGWQYWKTEILSGLIVCFAQVPETMAFSLMANLDPSVGLHATWIVGLFATALGNRNGLISGVTGAVAAHSDRQTDRVHRCVSAVAWLGAAQQWCRRTSRRSVGRVGRSVADGGGPTHTHARTHRERKRNACVCVCVCVNGCLHRACLHALCDSCVCLHLRVRALIFCVSSCWMDRWMDVPIAGHARVSQSIKSSFVYHIPIYRQKANGISQ